MCAIFRQDAARVRCTPRSSTVIRARGHHHFATLGGGTRDGDAHGGCIRAVLGEDRPVGVVDPIDEQFAQFHHRRRRTILTVSESLLPTDSLFHLGVMMTQHNRPVAAHEVDVFVAVDVPDACAVAPRHELREAFWHPSGALMAIHSVGDDGAGAVTPDLVGGEWVRRQ
jgi:hypothetical protein